jgi:PPM family protein phosphatase
MTTAAAGMTDPGRVRESNEDSLLVDTEAGLFAVADGMGGHNAGEVASRLAIETLAEFVRTSRHDASITWPYGFNTELPFEANQLKSAVQLANQQIRHAATQNPAYDGMGSTIIVVLAGPGQVFYANVGDSRLYCWRGGQLLQISEDDSWASSMLKAGADPDFVRTHAMRHMLTRALGSDQGLDVQVRQVPTAPGDLLLLCSDGLYGPLGDGGIADVLARPFGSLEDAAARLVRAANEAGGPDNVTAVLVHPPDGVPERTPSLASERGQAMSEYLVTAGVLVAIGIVAAGVLMNMFHTLVDRIAYQLQFIAP